MNLFFSEKSMMPLSIIVGSFRLLLQAARVGRRSGWHHHGDERHAALGALAGLVGAHVAVLGHRAGVILDSPAGLNLGERLAGHRHERHAAEGTFARMVVFQGDVLRHRADIDDSALPSGPRWSPAAVTARRRALRRFGRAHWARSIFWIASRNWLSESSMNWPEVTTRSPSLQPAQHLVEVVLGAQRRAPPCAARTCPPLQRDEDGVLFAAAQDGRVRHQQRRRRQFGGQLHRGEHARLEEIAGVVELHPHLGRARLLIHGRIDIGDAPAELAVRQIGEADGGLLPEPDKRQVLLVNLRLHPDRAQVGQPVELHPRLHHLALHDHLLDDNAIARRVDAERLPRLAVRLDLGDLLVGNVEEFELGQRAGLQRLGAGAEPGWWAD